MAYESKGTGLVILGVVAIVAVVGLVLLFRGGANATGAVIAGNPLALACSVDDNGVITLNQLRGAMNLPEFVCADPP